MARGKVDAQPGYVLHTYPFRETSFIVEAFTRDHGRVPLLARGARRPRSALRGLLLAFQPLELGWTGKGEVFTLMKAEWQGGQPLLAGHALFCGYYLNELLLHLLPREDAHPRLFAHYAQILQRLAEWPEGRVIEADLRRFEKALLQELGYGLTLDMDGNGDPVRPETYYSYQIEHGPMPVLRADYSGLIVRGRSLLDLAVDNYSDPRSLLESKQLMRVLLNYYLNGVELHSRRIFKELQEL
ncbi:MAG: repair protein RecO [Pseudomonadota bacterium]|jgi:DNA repair protein RecO (recombination protein O)